MERPLWDRIQEIYHSTLPMVHSERRAFVAAVCEHDSVVKREVNSLLDAEDSSGSFLLSPVFGLGLKLIASSGANNHHMLGMDDEYARPGRTIDGRYLIESELGKGGMGQVYLARDLTLHNRRVVIKVLLQTSLQNAYVVKKFRQEVEALARIDHPSVVSVLGAGKLPDGKLYLAMQYISGKTLRSQIGCDGMDLERAAAILQEIGAALEDVHQKGIFHRDLKPENIMLQVLTNGKELVKVVDFGIAKVKDSVVAPSTGNDVQVGTLLYMSPEQLRGGERITAASDIYSMSIIAYEMVTGRRPFNPASGPQLLEMHREGVRVKPADLRPNLSGQAQAIILRALSFEPSARYQSAGDFGDSLARALLSEEKDIDHNISERWSTKSRERSGDEPPLASSIQVTVRKLHRLRKTQFIVIASLLVLLVGVGVFLKSGTEEPNVGEPPTVEKPGPSRSLTYSLTVQKVGENQPSPSTGQETFETGDKFRLNVSGSDPGYLYLFNEGTPERGGSTFTLLYPMPDTNSGSATLGADQWVRTGWNEFHGQAGTENFWIVWSSLPVNQLEAAKKEAFKTHDGGLRPEAIDAVKSFLVTKQEEGKTTYRTDKNNEQTKVYGKGDVLVRMLQFKHK